MTSTTVRIAAMLPEHAEQVLAIYQLGIDSGDATLKPPPPKPEPPSTTTPASPPTSAST